MGHLTKLEDVQLIINVSEEDLMQKHLIPLATRTSIYKKIFFSPSF